MDKFGKNLCEYVILILLYFSRDLLFKTKYFSRYYIMPHVRAAPYLIGLFFGYVIFHTKTTKITINPWVNCLLWTASFAIMFSSMFGCHIFYLDSHEYNRLESSLYLTLSRTGWTIGLVWIMWACINGQGGMFSRGFILLMVGWTQDFY